MERDKNAIHVPFYEVQNHRLHSYILPSTHPRKKSQNQRQDPVLVSYLFVGVVAIVVCRGRDRCHCGRGRCGHRSGRRCCHRRCRCRGQQHLLLVFSSSAIFLSWIPDDLTSMSSLARIMEVRHRRASSTPLPSLAEVSTNTASHSFANLAEEGGSWYTNSIVALQT